MRNNHQVIKLNFVFLVILSLVVIVESIYIIYIIGRSTPAGFLSEKDSGEKITKIPGGKINLILEKGQIVKAGINLNAQLKFSTGEPIVSTDVILEFNPQLIAISRITGNENIFEQILINQEKTTDGKIKITTYLPKKTIKGEEVLATINFRLLRQEPTEIKIAFLGVNHTTDSNLVSQATLTDILTEVESLQLKP